MGLRQDPRYTEWLVPEHCRPSWPIYLEAEGRMSTFHWVSIALQRLIKRDWLFRTLPALANDRVRVILRHSARFGQHGTFFGREIEIARPAAAIRGRWVCKAPAKLRS